MENQTPAFLQKTLNLDFSAERTIAVTSQTTAQRTIGVLGMLLPLMLMGFLYLDTCHFGALESISHYYYTRVNSLLILIVGFLAFFLLIYKGKDPIDFYFSVIASVGALCLLLFPTGNVSDHFEDIGGVVVTQLADSKGREIFHYVSAAVFFLSLAYMSMFLFTRSNLPPAERSRNKKIRNAIYRLCGVLMVASLLVILISWLTADESSTQYDSLTFWMEVVAVEAFGLSWLTKSEWFLKG
jgi:hypothetical protein